MDVQVLESHVNIPVQTNPADGLSATFHTWLTHLPALVSVSYRWLMIYIYNADCSKHIFLIWYSLSPLPTFSIGRRCLTCTHSSQGNNIYSKQNSISLSASSISGLVHQQTKRKNVLWGPRAMKSRPKDSKKSFSHPWTLCSYIIAHWTKPQGELDS